MTTVYVPHHLNAAIQTNQRIRNGLYPHCDTQTMFANEANRIGMYRTKALDFWVPIATLPASGGAARARWRAMYHSSPLAKYLAAEITLAKSVPDTGSDPYGKILLELTDGTDVGTAEFHWGTLTGSNLDVPDNFRSSVCTFVDSSGDPVILSTDTDYRITCTDEGYSRMLAVSIYESSMPADPANGYVDAQAQVGTPIYDEDRGDIATLLSNQWKRGAAPLWHWASNTDASAPARSTNSFANLFDTSITTNSASSPGVKFYTANKSTVRRGNVPIKMWVYGAMAAGAGSGQVRLLDDVSFTLDVTINSTTAAWYSGTGNVTASNSRKYDLHFKGDGTNNLNVYAVTIQQYE